MMEQIQYRLNARIIKYSKAKQEERKREKNGVETSIKELKEELKQLILGENECLEKINRLAEKENSLDKMEEHLAKGASIRSIQEWDINAEGPGKILLKCENKYGQQKYMHSIVKRNERGKIMAKITGQKQVQEETTKYWEMFADKGITTEEEDINEYLGEEAVAGAKKITEQEREEMDKDITLEDIDEEKKDLKSDKSPGVTGFTNEFYKEFN